jgi:hypothetical protein
MEPFVESGLCFTPPGPHCFRFADCAAYKQISGRRVSEMDVGYWDERHRILVLLELKDYSTHEVKRDLRANLLQKGRDCLVMLHAAWAELGDRARSLRQHLPEQARTRQKLHLYFVLKIGENGMPKELLGPQKDELRNQINAYADLLGMGRLEVLVIDHHKAIEKGLPLSLPPA